MGNAKNNPSWEQAREWMELPDSPDMFSDTDFLNDTVMELLYPYDTNEGKILEVGKPITLAMCAEVFRRPVRRKEAWNGMEGRQGYRGDGTILARELGMDSFDNVTGFIDIDKGPQVLVDSEYAAPEDFLQKNDIVFVHVGTRERLCMVGFMRQNMNWCLPGPSLAVIRPRDINPVWLYYLLRTPGSWQEPISQAEAQFRKKIERAGKLETGKKPPQSSLMFLRISDVRRITFMPPSKREVAAIKGMDAAIVEKAGQISQITDEIREEQDHIHLFLTTGSDLP